MDIGFIRPAYLWGLLFLTVPILIHLLDRRRTRVLDFSTTRFFGSSVVAANRRHRITSILLLIVRMLILGVLTVIFAQPFRTADPLNRLGDPRAVFLFWVDPTVSMDYRDGPGTLHEKARAIVDSLQTFAPSGTRVRLYNHTPPDFREEIRFDFTAPRHGPGDLAVALAVFRKKYRDHHPVLFVISDFQDNGLQGVPAVLDSFFAENRIDFPVMCISVAPEKPWNSGITRAYFPPGNASGVTVRIAAAGRAVKGVPIAVTSRGIQAGKRTVDLAAGDSLIVEMPLAPELRASITHVHLESGDPFSHDDHAWCSPQRELSLRVLVVGDSDAVFPIAASLRSMGAGRWDPVIVRSAQQATYGDLDSAHLVVLAGVEGFIPALSRLLRTPAGRRRAFMVSPSLDTSIALFSEIPGLPHISTKPTVTQRMRVPVFPDTVSLPWRGFGRIKEGVGVSRYLRGFPGTAILPYDNGDPFITSFLDSNGNSWVFSTTPLHVDTANNLWHSGMYVALLDRLARYVLGRIGLDEEPWIAGIPHHNPCAEYEGGCTVYRDDGTVAGRWGATRQVVVDRPGIYRIESEENGPQWISVAVDPRETRFVYRAPAPDESIKRFVGFLRGDEAVRLLRERKAGVSADRLWILLCLLVSAEIALWTRPRTTGRKPT